MGPNQELYEHLALIAQLTELDGGGRFRVAAFKDASVAVRDLQYKITPEVVDTLPKVGDTLREVICDFIATGTSRRLAALGAKWPVEAMSMTKVKGIGAKTALKLHACGIKNFDELIAAAERGEIDDKIRAAVLLARDFSLGRVQHSIAKAIADQLANQVAQIPGVLEVCVAGSVRRKKPTSKDIDLVAKADVTNHAAILAEYVKLGDMLNTGDVKSAIVVSMYATKIQCDMWMVKPQNWGAALNYATGSKNHNERLRGLAKARGMRINEYGIFRVNDDDSLGERLGGESEQDIYRILDIPYVDPDKREE
jgi:DNA polymerase (family 10)